MKKKLLLSIATVVLLLVSNTGFGQTPNGTLNLGILESFEGFTGGGAVTNNGTSWTGDAGTNEGALAGFSLGPPSFIGNTYANNASTAQARFDLFRLYIHLNGLYVDYPNTHAPSFGTGETIKPGVYSILGAGGVLLDLTLDGTTNGVDNPNAFFVIKFAGAFNVGAGANIILKGGTKSCNVFFMSDSDIAIGAGFAGSKFKGNLFSKIGAVGLGDGVNLEGRMYSMKGAIVSGSNCVVYPPADECTIPVFCQVGCDPAPVVANVLGTISNYALYTTLGEVSNSTVISGIDGNVGTNVGANPSANYIGSIIVGEYHAADSSTSQAKTDIIAAYNALMALPATIPNLSAIPPVPAHVPVFGSVPTLLSPGETIFPGVYDIDAPTGAGILSTLILDGQGSENSIFVFRFKGTMSVGAAAKMILINKAKRCNIFWISGAYSNPLITGPAIDIGAGAVLQGTFLSHNGACGSGAGTFLAGRQLSTMGAVTTYGGIIYNNPACVTSVTLNIKAITETTAAISGGTGGTTPALTSNDVIGGVAVTIGTVAGNVTMSILGTLQAGLSVDTATGIVTIAPNTPPGSYLIEYTICEFSRSTKCSTVKSYITVTGPAPTIWDGSTDTAWNDPTNWSAGVPLPNGDVIIPVVTNYPVLDQDRSIGNLSIATGATEATGATLSLGSNTLTVKGAFSGTGTLIGGSATSGLTINGTGNQGTFYMNQTTPGTTNKVGNFTLDSTPLGSATLGNAMGISGILTLTNGTFKTGGNLTLTSNGSGTAVVAPILDCSAVAINGDVMVERFFPAGRAFRLISSPVTTDTTIRENWQEGQNNATTNYSTNLNPNPGYGTHITGNMTANNGFDYTQTANNSMFTYNNSTSAWVAAPNTNVLKLNAGDPYRLMIRGSRAINMSTNAPIADNTTLRAKGTLKICDASAGTMSQAVDGFSFIGNPYQATVDIKSVLSSLVPLQSSNVNPKFYYVWDPKVSTRGAYIAYDLDSFLNPVASSSVNKYLQPWQACFVKTLGAGAATITFKELNKSPLSSVNENVYRTTNLASYIRLTLYESNTLASNGAAADGLIVKFGDNYDNAIDGNDALKFNNLDETFATKNNTTLLGIESRLLPVASDVIPLNIAQYRFTNYTMVASGTNMGGLPAYLHDQLLETYTEIPQSDSVNYSYVLDSTNPATSASDRFRIVFQNPFLNLESNAALVFTMSPNPSKQGVFDVVMNGATADTKLVIYNTIGQEVYATNLTQATINHINPNKVFANGVYFVKIEKDAATTIKKLIIR